MKTMRHLFRVLPLWALLLGVASCDKEDIVTGGNGAEASGERVPMTFTALAPQTGQAQTRTELQPGEVGENGQTTYAVYWNAGDQIGIYDGQSFQPFTIDLQEGETAATANFSGEALPGTGSYLAFYPYSEGLTCTDGAVGFTLPVTQTAQAGSFASGVNPAWAQTTEAGGQLTFHNAAALVKFALTAEDAAQVSNAVLTDMQGKPLAGGFSLSVADGGATLTGNSGNTFASVKLEGPFGMKAADDPTADYLFVVACGEKQLESGFTLAFNLTNGGQKTLTASGGLGAGQSLAAGVITNLGEIPLDGVPVTGVPISYGGESSTITTTGEIWAD
ncbi:fimbrillin family protein [Bacteroides sp. ET336]|uniref:fimbrillin family protein n=1 Tax=Bacteroides sp. ET336 TaxID=2972459 RepID=UPI0021AC1A89|nr:fimbrillin family protein [Bacteroides sp. ET336]MCR8892568.1 fimbrillin family protein [Bacteroides sp. ET336]MDN0057064.1 fimbrillin family protein [Bacteroides caecigallinarum]